MKRSDMYIFYVNHQDHSISILCEDIEDCKIIPNHYLLKGVVGLSDNAFPMVSINSISIHKNNINYYVKGESREAEEPPKLSSEVIEVEEKLEPSEEPKRNKKGRRGRKVKS